MTCSMTRWPPREVEIVHPARRLQPHVDRLERRAESSDEADQRIVQRRAEGEEDAFALRRDVIPEVEAELALVRERQIEARRGAGRPALVSHASARAIGVERDVVAGAQQPVRGDEARDA